METDIPQAHSKILAELEIAARNKGYSIVEEKRGDISLYSGDLVAFVGSIDSVIKLLREIKG